MSITRFGSESGQASVELVGTLPALLLVCLIAWELVVAGQTAWLGASAARVAARAAAVGRDSRAAARSALPRSLARGLKVEDLGGGRVRVTLPIPLLVSGWHTPLSVHATAGLEPG